MISNILTSFFNCLSVPILVLNHKFETVFTYNHDSDINNSLYISKAIEKLKNIDCSSNTFSLNITSDIAFTCITFNHYDNNKMHLLLGPYTINEDANYSDAINTLTEEWLNNIIKLHSYIIDNHICIDKTSTNNSPCVNHAIKYIEKNYTTEISIDDICSELNINKCYFCSVFKKETGSTFINYLNNYKIEKSKELLKNPNISLLDVSLSVGYNNQSYFSTVFKKITSKTPLEFRDEYLKNKK
ncbi:MULTISPECIES: helix-turn-helix domain-containing protein [Clostridium]|uniref:AraC family transcriptional regulator n=1 Tax=Clostridium disporicum TaxID=84024 RepID=A0A174FYE6_9CLOT|nr:MULTISPECIES: AraC family transcriptional regulator [Clostridium]MDU3522448.1 AraC family transcriptional regulator [Clostridium saudiense]MDU7454703.1 AraC family transcriptional regulator [Clostridium saudiense]CUO54701.1 AraC family transcriptional regulator [Clostridium disporicum]CUO81367.1 AraC family transcriptional regulator [Clostridium disporicum]SCJ71011.1 Methylphosphotriester-DNA--protein-cysteine S-methyltransferase [uncultured Clostridium sp.]